MTLELGLLAVAAKRGGPGLSVLPCCLLYNASLTQNMTQIGLEVSVRANVK